MDGGVDPSTPLGQQHAPLVGGDSVGMGVTDELSLVVREMLQEQSRQVTIFTQMQQILLVQGVDSVLGIVADDLVRDEEGFVGVGRSEAVHRETTGKTSNGPEETFEGFGEMMGDKVFVYLHHGDDRLFRIRQLRFSANTDGLLVADHPKVSGRTLAGIK